jgi:hypothetical protein
MPTLEQWILYINAGFLAIVALAVLVGLVRGFKKSLYVFITMAGFYIVFFVTIGMIADTFYAMELSFLGSTLGQLDPAFSSVTSIQEAVVVALQTYGGDTINLSDMSPALTAMITGLGIFVIKILYTILYFTVGLILWKLVFGIIRLIFFGSKKKEGKNAVLGAVVGLAHGVMTVFVTLIVMGGLIDIAHSVVTLASPLLEGDAPADVFEQPNREEIYQASQSLFELSELPGDAIDQSMASLQDIVEAFDQSIVVQIANGIVVPEISGADVDIPLHIYLFDEVMSFPYDETDISLRHELSIFAAVGGVLLSSDFAETQDIADITGDQIRDVFDLLSRSSIVVSAIPAAIEFAIDYFEVDYEVDTAELAAIDWSAELQTLGVSMATLFDIISQAGLLEENPDLETIDVDGDLVRDLFNSLGDSQLLVIAVEVFLVPMIEEDPELNLLLTIPADLDWATELEAVGALVGAIVDADISIAELQEGSFPVIINALSQIDFSLLLDSRLISNMMVNVLSGQAGIEGLDILVVPDDIVWFDVLDGFGNVVTPGELRNILNAVNAILDAAGDLDLANLGLSTIANFSDAAIDTIFESRILVATISDVLLSQDLGGETLVIPAAVFDGQGYLLKTELSAIVKSIKLLATEVVCDPLDTQCDPNGFDPTKVLQMSGEDLDTLLDSQIIAATFGKIILDMGDSFLTIPASVVQTVALREGSADVVAKAEILKVLDALMLLGLADFENFSFGPNILSSLELIPPVGDPTELDDTKIATLLASEIVHATVSKMILDLTSGTSNFLIVPERDANDVAVLSTAGGTDYVSKAELGALLKALYALDIADFDQLSAFSVATLLDNLDALLDSAILHATFSKQILDLNAFLDIPYHDASGVSIRVTTGVTVQTTFIVRDELSAFVEAIEVFGITDLDGFSGGFDLGVLTVEANRNKILSSAILHKTISKQLFDAEGSALKIPAATEDGTALKVTVGVNPNQDIYVAAFEIHALLVALDAMGFDDLTSFSGSINSSTFFSNPSTILNSSIMQATISDQLLTGTGGVLQVPNAVRVTQGATTYIAKTELTHLIDALNAIGFTDFGNFDFDDPSTLFAADPNILFASETLQLTVSDTILDIASDETAAAGTMTLVVPHFFRETVNVGAGTVDQIELVELKRLFLALDQLGVTSFGSSFNATAITSMSQAELNVLLASGSMHTTVDKILRGNTNIASEIPSQAEVGAYGIAAIVTKAEIIAFINAVKALGGSDFASFSFSLGSLTPANQDIALDSYIVLNALSDEIVAAVTLKNLTFEPDYVIQNSDYIDGNPTSFLSKAGALGALDFINNA